MVDEGDRVAHDRAGHGDCRRPKPQGRGRLCAIETGRFKIVLRRLGQPGMIAAGAYADPADPAGRIQQSEACVGCANIAEQRRSRDGIAEVAFPLH